MRKGSGAISKDEKTVAEIMDMRRSGMSVDKIAEHYGVSKARIYQVAGDELVEYSNSEAPPGKRHERRKIDVRKIKSLMQRGYTIPQIAKEYNVSRTTIYNKLKDEEKRMMGENKVYSLEVLNKDVDSRVIDPETGIVINTRGKNAGIIGRMGDERVTAFVNYHLEMLAMRQGVDKRDVDDLYNRFVRYLKYCAENGVVPNNMNAYFAIGVSANEIRAWKKGVSGTPRHKQFAEDITAFFASIHEQGGTDGVLNPIQAIFWQKAHDGLIEASKLEVVQEDPLGTKRSAEDIAKTYSEVELPD